MAPKGNYYDTLGVKKDASADEIKKAFRRLARKHHPDAGGDEEKFKEINEAYEILSDTEKRAQFDQYGQYFGGQAPPNAGRGGAAGWPGPGGANVDMGDIFGDIFGGAGFGGGRRGGPQPRRGRDVQVNLDLSFDAALTGTSAQVKIERAEECAVCKGTGAKPGTSRTTCPTCKGSGSVSEGQGMFGFARPCPTCGGSGSVIQQPCQACRGAGRVTRMKPVTVNVPAGATDGGKLRFKGQGESGDEGGPAGDLYVITRIKPHPYFARDGADVTMDLPISVSEAALGAQITVPTPDGAKVKIKVPGGTQHDKILRIGGKGAPKLKGSGHGDLKIKIKIVIPEALTDEQREIFEQLAEATPTDLRAHIG